MHQLSRAILLRHSLVSTICLIGWKVAAPRRHPGRINFIDAALGWMIFRTNAVANGKANKVQK